MTTTSSIFSKVLSGSLLVAGTTIGAGMLGIPLITSECGFFPACLITALVWLFMLLTGMLLLKSTLWMKGPVSFLSLSKRFLGRGGEVFTGVMFIFLYYSLMIAYFSAGSHLLMNLFNVFFGLRLSFVASGCFFSAFFFVVILISPKSIDRVNIGISLLMFAAWFLIMGIGSSHVNMHRLEEVNFRTMWMALPLLFGAFGYHNIIPSLVTYLNRDRKALILSITIGTLLPLMVYLCWQWLIMGSLPKEAIHETLQKGLPVTFALQRITESPAIFITGQLFALFAIVTSVLGVSFSLIDFLADGFRRSPKGKNRIWLSLLTILPPALFALNYSLIFEKALSIAGGFGEAILNGILPVALVASGQYIFHLKRYKTIRSGSLLLIILLLCSLLVVTIESMHLFNYK